MMARLLRILFACAPCLTLAACGSDDSSEPDASNGTLAAFHTSECKKENASALTATEAYAGLQCIRWQPGDGGTLQVELVNFDGACGAQWKGSASSSDAGLTLRATNPGCMLAACGSCIYDWTFDVKLEASVDLSVSVVTDPCPGEQTPETDSATLPLATTPAGELCRYADFGALGWQAASLGTCGVAYMPCRSGNGMCSLGSGQSPCDTGLECATGANAADEICHAVCTDDTQCAPAGILTCQSGLCRPAKSW